MVALLLPFILATMCYNISYAHKEFELIIEPRWQPITQKEDNAFNDEWIIVGSITFKKKAKAHVNLARLYLQWTGTKLDHLIGSLYYKNPTKDFIPIQDNLICDGAWNSKQQILKLTFDQDHTLGSVNVFYVVLSLPKSIIPTIKGGKFKLVEHTIPEQFRPTTADPLMLCLDALDCQITQ